MTCCKNLNLKLSWLAIVAAALALCFWLTTVSHAALSDCIDATCRITTADGGRGTGCVFEIGTGSVYVLTAAHVVGTQPSVECEFWRAGHQSRPLAARVVARSESADAAILALAETAFAGVLPKAVPLAPRNVVVRPGDTLTSVGCAAGAWSTGWKGHALRADADELRFLPPPANGRSGSAVFDAEGRQIVGLLRARTTDNAEGIATALGAIYRAFDRTTSTGKMPVAHAGGTPAPQLAQCGPGGCPGAAGGGRFGLEIQGEGSGGCGPGLLERWQQRRTPQQQQPQPAPATGPWPSLPPADAAPGKKIDLDPLDQKLQRIVESLEELKAPRRPEPATPLPPAPAAPEKSPTEDVARAALAAVDQLAAESKKGLAEVKADAAKAQDAAGKAVSGTSALTDVVERIKESISENGTISQRYHARMDRVRQELEEKLGREATDRESRIAYLKDLVQEKLADGGLVGLAKALGLPLGLVLVVWLITRDVKHKRETGDPLVVEKLATMIEGRFSALQGRFDALKDRLHGAGTSSSDTPKTA